MFGTTRILFLFYALVSLGKLVLGSWRIQRKSQSMLYILRGGLVPEANGVDAEYYEKFRLDYGCDDNVRIAGSMRGLISSGSLALLLEGDPFLRWLNEKLEKGPQPPKGRVKPYYVSV